MSEPSSTGFAGRVSRIYDVFVDWPGRLAREMPGIEKHLRAVGARRVLDLGCGTGRHVQALLERGYDAHGADVSDDMLAQARSLVGAERVHAWRLGDPPPSSVTGKAPFDAAIAMGNVWPILSSESEARGTADAVKQLVRPGGLLLLGFKAFEVRRRSGNPYLPLLRREHEGKVLWFVRFVVFDVLPQPRDGSRACEMHMAVLAGDASTVDEHGEAGALLHRASRLRSWDPVELTEWLRARGFADVRISGKLDDPEAPVTSEDVFAIARVASP
jgi:SAM-dependent methyltransferase